MSGGGEDTIESKFTKHSESVPAPSSTPTPTPAVNSPVESMNTDRTRKLTSPVWTSFKKMKIDGADMAICNKCERKLKANSKNGTKHLHEHLIRCPKRDNQDIRQTLLRANQRISDGKTEYRSFVFDQEFSRRELANAIILHEYPLAMVDHAGFKSFASSLQPLFKMVTRNTIKSDILKIHESEKEKAYKLLEKLDSRIAITTDMWTSNHNKKGYMAITGHFIDESWILQSRILRFVYVPAPHNKETLSEVLIDSFLDWNIDRKLSTITMDNCSTNDAVIDVLLGKLDSSSILLNGRVFHMRCCAHILNLIVKDGLEVIGEGIERIRDSVVYWTATPGRIEKFHEAARQLRILGQKKLSLDCKTRWNSTYIMLQTALVYKDVFPRVKQRERNYNSVPREDDWMLATEICEKLEMFYDVTMLFSGTNYPTTNCFFLHICEIRLALYQWVENPNLMISVMASKMIDKFEKYWDVCHTIMAIATVLDPRYKLKLVEFYYNSIYGDTASVEIETVRQCCYDLVHDYQKKFKTNDTPLVGEASCDSYPSNNTVAKVPLDKFYSYVIESSTTKNVRSEFDFYLEENPYRADNFDILNWWKANALRYPTLQRIARDILAIPVSTVASESAFSTSGRLISPHRSRLHPSTVEALMCSQSWLWTESQATCSTSKASRPPTICDDNEPQEDIVLVDLV